MIDKVEYIYGIFRYELKNRFLCLVNIDGIDTVCYIPSSSRLENFIDLKNKKVLLVPTEAKNARTRYSVYAIKKKQNYIILNTSVANNVIREALSKRRFYFLGSRKSILREKRIGNYKCDLYIEDTNTLVEVKSIITEDHNAIFPTVHSDRAISQLKEISTLLDNGYNALYCFVSLNPYVNTVKINSYEQEYYHLFCDCIDKGMQLFGVSIGLKNNMPVIRNSVNIDVKV